MNATKPAHDLSQMPRSLVNAVVILAMVLLAVVLFAMALRAWKSPDQREMESLAQFVLDNGRPAPMPLPPLHYFGLPTEEVTFCELRAGAQSGRTKGVFVRERKGGIVDIFFADIQTDLSGYVYLTSTHAKLVKAAYFSDKPEMIEDAAERFELEKDFWYS